MPPTTQQPFTQQINISTLISSFPTSTKSIAPTQLNATLQSITQSIATYISTSDLSIESFSDLFNQCNEKFRELLFEDIFVRSEEDEDDTMLDDDTSHHERPEIDFSALSETGNFAGALVFRVVLLDIYLGQNMEVYWGQALGNGLIFPQWAQQLGYSLMLELSSCLSADFNKKCVSALKKCCSVWGIMSQRFAEATQQAADSQVSVDVTQSFVAYSKKIFNHFVTKVRRYAAPNVSSQSTPSPVEVNALHQQLAVFYSKKVLTIIGGAFHLLLKSLGHILTLQKESALIVCMNQVLSLLDLPKSSETRGIQTQVWPCLTALLKNFHEQLSHSWSSGTFMNFFLTKVHAFMKGSTQEMRELSTHFSTKNIKGSHQALDSQIALFKEYLKCLMCFSQFAHYSSSTRSNIGLLSSVFVCIGEMYVSTMEACTFASEQQDVLEPLGQMFSRLDDDLRTCAFQHLQGLYQIDAVSCLELFAQILNGNKATPTMGNDFHTVVGSIFVAAVMMTSMMSVCDKHDAPILNRLISETLPSVFAVVSSVHPLYFSTVMPNANATHHDDPTYLDYLISDLYYFITKALERSSEHEMETLLDELWRTIVEEESVICSIVCCHSIIYSYTQQAVQGDSVFVSHVLQTMAHILLTTGHNLYSPLPADAPPLSVQYVVTQKSLSNRMSQIMHALSESLHENHIEFLRKHLHLPSMESVGVDLIHTSQVVAQLPLSLVRLLLLEPDVKNNFSITFSLLIAWLKKVPQLVENIVRKTTELELPVLQSFLLSMTHLLEASMDSFWKSHYRDIVAIFMEKESVRGEKNPTAAFSALVESLLKLIQFTPDASRLPKSHNSYQLERAQDAALKLLTNLLLVQQSMAHLPQCIITDEQVITLVKQARAFFEKSAFMRPSISVFVRRMADVRISTMRRAQDIFTELSHLIKLLVIPPRAPSTQVDDITLVSILGEVDYEFIKDYVYFFKNSGMPNELLKNAMPVESGPRNKITETIKSGHYLSFSSRTLLESFSKLQKQEVDLERNSREAYHSERQKMELPAEQLKQMEEKVRGSLAAAVTPEVFIETEKALSNSVILLSRLAQEPNHQLGLHRLGSLIGTLNQLVSEMQKKAH